jgi:hypothetical protein
LPIVPEHLDQATAPEDEQVSAMRITPQRHTCLLKFQIG